MNTITIEHAGKSYTVRPSEGSISITVDGVWAGNGKVNEHGQIEDCAAVLDEGAYDAIENALAATKGANAKPVHIERMDVTGEGSVGIDLSK